MKTKFYLFISFLLVLLLFPCSTKAGLDGILVYGEGTVQTPRYRLWNGMSQTWSSEYSANSVGGTIEWVEVASCPVRDEYILAIADANDHINVQINSSKPGTPCWHDGTTCGSVLEVTTTSVTTDTRKVDVAYEMITGDALVVYSDNTDVPKVRIWNGIDWTTQVAVNDSSISIVGPLNITGIVEHVKLVSRPNSDEIALVYATSNDNLNVLIWNGTHFYCEPSTILETNLHANDYQKFDADYEQVSGDLFIAWGFGTTSDLKYATKTAGTCTFSVATETNFNEIGMEVSVAAQPGSDFIMVSEHDGGTQDDMHAGIWDGTRWLSFSGNERSLYASEAVPNRLIASGWAGKSGRGILIYSDAATNTNVDYFIYNKIGNTWSGGTTGLHWTPTPSLTDEDNNIRSYSFLDENKTFVFIKDEAQDLWAKIYNGDTNSWSNTEGGTALETTVSSLEFPSFDFTFRRYLKRWLEVDWTSGSQVNSTCTPSQPCDFAQYATFNANATVTCKTDPPGSSCGSISGGIRYNETVGEPNKLISTTKNAIPFYVVGSKDLILEWEKVTDYSTGEDAARRVATDSQGNIIAVGWDYIGSVFNWRVIKYSPTGSEIWINTSSNARANGVAVDSQDNIIVVGYTGSGTTSSWKIVKFNPAGSVIWEKITSYTDGGGAWAVTTDSQDNIIVGGLDNTPGNYEWRVVKYNSTGSILWENVTNYGSAGDEIFGIATDSQDNIIVVGFTSDTPGGDDQWRTVKYNSNGVMLWTNATNYASGSGNNDMIRDVAVDSHDNIIVVGNDVVPGNNEWRIVKFNSTGSVLLEKVIDYTSNDDIAYGVAIDTKDNIIVAGQENLVVGGDGRARVVKYNSTGSELWTNIVNPTTGNDLFYDAITDLKDSIVLVGYDYLSGGRWRIMKFSIMGVNPISCGSMSHGDVCQLNWEINVTGNPGEAYRIDVNFTSDTNIWNDTNDAYIRIIYPSADTSFRITIPTGLTTWITSTDPLNPTPTTGSICFNASSNLPFPQFNINASNCQGAYQNETMPIIEFTNTGNTNVNFTLYLNQTLVPGVYIRCLKGSFDPNSAIEIGTNPWLVDYNIPPNNARNVFCWLNVTLPVSPQELTREFRYRTSQA